MSAFDNVAYDTVAAIVNDLCCVGAVPLVVNAYFATGSSDWYADEDRNGGLCSTAGARRAWTPARPGAGASRRRCRGSSPAKTSSSPAARSGSVPPGREPILGDRAWRPGDEIVIVESNGLHANGSSLARRVAGAAATTATGRRSRAGGRSARRCSTATAMYAGLVRALLASDGRGPLPQPHHRPRAAEADAPAPRADLHGGGAAGGSGGARVPRRAGRDVTRRRVLDVQHGVRLRRLLRAAGRARRSSGSRPGWDCRRASPAPSRRARAASCSRRSGSCSRAATWI